MKICVLTGCTSGVGRGLALRLVEEHPKDEPITLCLTYRNSDKLERVKEELLSSHPKVTVDAVKLDLGLPKTVVNAAREISSKYDHIDYIFLNAGRLFVDSLNWPIFWSMSLSKYLLFLTSGVGFTNQSDEVTSDGLQTTFVTNTASHYIMLKELQPLLEEQEERCHVIWSGSRTAKYGTLDPDDIQNRRCKDPYYTSKQAIDILSVELNKRLNSKGVYSDVACPGCVMTPMTYAVLPKWFWWSFLVPFFVLLRFVSLIYTLFPRNGSESHIWLSKQNPSSLDHTVKYCSTVNGTWTLEVKKQPHLLSEDLTKSLMKELDDIAEKFM
jgi:17beta-estradiol 17-dehydrogenase/3beta-hydroxysteroid 3-dehydrogenase